MVAPDSKDSEAGTRLISLTCGACQSRATTVNGIAFNGLGHDPAPGKSPRIPPLTRQCRTAPIPGTPRHNHGTPNLSSTHSRHTALRAISSVEESGGSGPQTGACTQTPAGTGKVEELALPFAGHATESFTDPREPGVTVHMSSWVVPPTLITYARRPSASKT